MHVKMVWFIGIEIGNAIWDILQLNMSIKETKNDEFSRVMRALNYGKRRLLT